MWRPPGSFHFGAGVDFFKNGGESADFAVPCRQDHALRFDAHELRRLEIGDDDDGFADQRFRFIFLADAGDDLSLLGPSPRLTLAA